MVVSEANKNEQMPVVTEAQRLARNAKARAKYREAHPKKVSKVNKSCNKRIAMAAKVEHNKCRAKRRAAKGKHDRKVRVIKNKLELL